MLLVMVMVVLLAFKFLTARSAIFVVEPYPAEDAIIQTLQVRGVLYRNVCVVLPLLS